MNNNLPQTWSLRRISVTISCPSDAVCAAFGEPVADLKVDPKLRAALDAAREKIRRRCPVAMRGSEIEPANDLD
jgi:hypothetical protein